MISGKLVTCRKLYAYARTVLGSAFEAKQLFTHITGKHFLDLAVCGDEPTSPEEIERMQALCARRAGGEPLQYLLGEWEFFGLPFRVGPGVLIPRQDTETLVETALEKMAGVYCPQVLDLCSGTGCVAIALEKNLPGAEVTALELSDQAFGYLRENIALNESEVQPVHGDLLTYTHPEPLDLLSANPPYIPRGDLDGLQTEVQHEPRLALDGGEDGLELYRAIVRRYRQQLRPGGWICMEVGIGQSGDVCDLLETGGFFDAGEKKDYTGVARVVFARRPCR